MVDVGKEYGAALFMLAREAGMEAQYADALAEMQAQFAAYPDYPAFLASPSIPQSVRLAAIEEAFADHLPTEVTSFLMLLCEKGRMACLDAAVAEYTALYRAAQHVFDVSVTCAAELSEQEKEKLKKKLESTYGGEMRMTYVLDRTLLGGLIVEVDGKILDGSLRRRLRDVKEVMNV